MPTMTLSVPEDLYTMVKKHNEIKWSEIARRAMWDYAIKIEMLESILSKSELTEDDVSKIDKKVKKAL